MRQLSRKLALLCSMTLLDPQVNSFFLVRNCAVVYCAVVYCAAIAVLPARIDCLLP